MQIALTGIKLDGTGTLTQSPQSLEFAATSTVDVSIAVTGQNGSPINLSGCALVFSVRTSTYKNATLVVSIQATIDSPAAGTAHFPIPNTAFQLARGAYVYDVTLINPDGSTDQVVPVGSLYITDSSYTPGQQITPLASQLPLGQGPQGVAGGVYVVANDFAGSDIGAQINAAAQSLANGGVVQVRDGNYVQTTKVIIPSGVTVRLGYGTISNSFAAGTAHWQLKDNSSLIGAGWNTKLMGQVQTVGGAATVGDFNSVADNSVVGNSNLLVRDIQFIRNPASTTSGVQTAAIQFGNVKNAYIEHCYFNGCEGYGVFQASSSITGNHGDGFFIKDCVFENITTQNCGVINCANWQISGNIFRPTTVTSNYTIIDCESNTATDVLRQWQIVDNIFDFKSSAIFNPGSMIQIIGGGGSPLPYKSAYAGRATYGVISGNVCISGDFTTNISYFGQGINLVNCDEIVVSDNNVYGASIPISVSTCNSVVLSGNATGYGKNNDAWHIELVDSFDCFVKDNKCVEHFGAGWSTPNIAESGTSDYNVYQNNHVAFYPYVDPVATGGRYAKISLSGAHSRVLGGVMGPVPTPVDAPLVTSTSELRALDIPGARTSTAPAVVVLGGRSSQADGGWSVWKYDPTSTLTDNDITVVKPSNASAQWNGVGRWLRAPGTLRMTTTARNALSMTSSDAGTTIWNTTTLEFEVWNGTGWVAVGSSAGGTQGGATSASHVPYASSSNTLADGELSFDSATHKYTVAATTILDFSSTSSLVKVGAGLSSATGDLPFAFGGSATPHFTMSDLGGVYALYFGAKSSNDYIFAGSNQFIFRTNGQDAMSLTQNLATISGGLKLHQNIQSGTSYTINSADVWVVMTNPAARAVTLPAASNLQAGQIVHVKDGAATAGTANITISRSGTDTIDGATSYVINQNGGFVAFASNGSNTWWRVI